MCVRFYYFLTLGEAAAADFETSTIWYELQNYEWGVKTNIDCSFIWGMLENCCTLGKIQH